MATKPCPHGSLTRAVLHVHHCPRCGEWRLYTFTQDWQVRHQRGPLGTATRTEWGDLELTGLHTFTQDDNDPFDDTALIRRLLLSAQERDQEIRSGYRRQGATLLLHKMEGGREQQD